MLPSRSLLNIGKSFPLFTVLICGASLLSFDINSNSILADAQTVAPLAPTSPDNSTGRPTIQITSPQDDQQVPPGELSIQGISSDNEDTDCKVFADVNDNTPMQNVTATGDSGEKDDFRMDFYIQSRLSAN
jgi:hypothetical protein